jgi:5-carboxymethyl-2-hydroxymuconate isomerase
MVACEAQSDDVVRLINRVAEDGPRLAIVLDEDMAVDAVDLDSSLPATMAELVESVDAQLPRLRAAQSNGVVREHVRRPMAGMTLMAPVGRVGKIVAIGKNYREHALEEGVEAAEIPVMFAKFPSAIVGPGTEIHWRTSDTGQVDWEAELAVVIGRTARDVPVASALDHVLGYTCLNDVSARDLQFGDGQWTRGKSLDTFCPMGPWLVTSDEIPDPQALRIRLLVDGECLQDASTGQMLHGVAELIAFCSTFMTLDRGDVLATGTPAGVGAFRSPPRFLADGEEVVVEIERIGRLSNRCRVLSD